MESLPGYLGCTRESDPMQASQAYKCGEVQKEGTRTGITCNQCDFPLIPTAIGCSVAAEVQLMI
ncbi:hypothetical protein H8959_020693 [Pygathrix nigripes]